MKKIYILAITLVSTFAVNAQVSFGNMQNQISRGKDVEIAIKDKGFR